MNPTLTGTDMGVDWFAMVSTTTVSARDNAFVQAPVFRLDGERVADDFADIWDGTIDKPIDLSQTLRRTTQAVWTDTRLDGTSQVAALGHFGVFFGLNFATNLTWIDDSVDRSYHSLPLYPLSERLTAPNVAESAPLPSATRMGLPMAGMIIAAEAMRQRRRRGRAGSSSVISLHGLTGNACTAGTSERDSPGDIAACQRAGSLAAARGRGWAVMHPPRSRQE